MGFETWEKVGRALCYLNVRYSLLEDRLLIGMLMQYAIYHGSHC